MQNQTEFRIVFHLAITKPDRPSFLDSVSADDRIKNWINGLVDVFQQHSVTSYDGVLDHVQVVLLSKSYDTQLSVAAGTSALSQRRIPSLKL